MSNNNLLNYVLALADDRLILSHRLAEWCGHAPILEEDIALTNIALDSLGQASLFYKYAADIEGNGRTEDDYAYKRSEREFRNLLLVEQANQDFAYTLARQFFFDAYELFLYEELLKSSDSQLQAIAEKSIKETKYHIRHSTQWMLRLGDGTDESKLRIQAACDYLWMYVGEMFTNLEEENDLIINNIIPANKLLWNKWFDFVSDVMKEATLITPPPDAFMQSGGRHGIHTEHLGHILADMQYLPRTYPNAKW
ncbi:MAG TPA: phenylacetate-CoA oxygenase subunit PaaC [Candidatus Kapabacteria bacterium]|nr:phenylacetate-CoA oxygenase subunit PaaC [Candidatus Kapabacteria bacterium]